jgi:rhodanese-related sulfurtransferase
MGRESDGGEEGREGVVKQFILNTTLHQRLAALALALGALAIVAGDPYQGHTATIDAKELSIIVQKEVDHVAPLDLADWIIQGRTDYRLIDVRSEKEFATYAIPGAENVPVASLPDHGLMKNDKIVLYSDGGIHAAQAWMLLRSLGYKGVYMLRGGLEGWNDDVLFPSLAETADAAARINFAKTAEVSKYFGGTPRTGGGPVAAARPAIAAPKLDTPAGVAPAGGAKKKKKEGC